MEKNSSVKLLNLKKVWKGENVGCKNLMASLSPKRGGLIRESYNLFSHLQAEIFDGIILTNVDSQNDCCQALTRMTYDFPL